MTAEQLLEATAKSFPSPTIDGYLFPKPPIDVYLAGGQAHVPLLVGSNSEELPYRGVLGEEQPTLENYHKALQRLYGDKAGEVFKLYPAATENEVKDAARDLPAIVLLAIAPGSGWTWLRRPGASRRTTTFTRVRVRLCGPRWVTPQRVLPAASRKDLQPRRIRIAGRVARFTRPS